MRSYLINGRVFGGCGFDTPEWAEAVLVEEGRVAAVGSLQVCKFASSQVNLSVCELPHGTLLLPGLCDAHLHLASGGRALKTVNLGGLDVDGVQRVMREAARRSVREGGSTGWMRGTNWEPARCKLDAAILDRVTTARPLFVGSRDGHSCCCNSAALKLAGISSSTPDLPGGIIGRSSDGNPNGWLYESAVELVRAVMPEADAAAWRSSILQAQQHLLSLGLTAVSEVLNPGTEAIYRELDRSGELVLEVDGWLRIEDWSDGEPPPPDGDRFRLRTIKLFLDGAFGSGTAALEQPYADAPDSNGMLLHSDGELVERLLPVVKAGWRLAMHAIGDRAVAQACRVLAQLPRAASGPHRIEHLQLLPEDGVQMLARSGAAASVQPVHLTQDQPWLSTRIGALRCRRSFIWRSLVDAGVALTLGSDWPVSSADPLQNLHVAVNRRGFGQEPLREFDPAEALPPCAAIRSATNGWAAAAGVAGRRGCIIPGQTADFTAVMGVSEELRDWSGARVVMTICRGRVVFQRGKGGFIS